MKIIAGLEEVGRGSLVGPVYAAAVILKKKINSIEDCNLKSNSKNLILGDGNINSSIMLIGESPGEL